MAWFTPSISRAARLPGAALLAVPLLVISPGLAPHALAAGPAVSEVDLVSSVPSSAPITDPNLVNAWGLALSATSPMWVANNGTNTSTLYAGGTATTPVSKAALTVTIPGGAPTGQIFNDTSSFVVTGPTGASGPARFLFVSEDGDLTGWSPAAQATNAILAAHSDGANYKGMALLHTDGGAFILAADFAHGRIDVYDGQFRRLPATTFRDTHLPAGFAPFNVAVIGGAVYVAYAQQVDGNEIRGAGLGFVDRFDGLGLAPQRLVNQGMLNAPWGLAIAPAAWGEFAGDLLVGNFGDGHINVYDPVGGRFLDQLRDAAGQPIVIRGLWALTPGTANTGGVNSVWFSAGPQRETQGLLGVLRPVS